jgi:hypothetical protein
MVRAATRGAVWTLCAHGATVKVWNVRGVYVAFISA